MAKSGRGKWIRYNTKTCADEVGFIDVRHLKRQGAISSDPCIAIKSIQSWGGEDRKSSIGIKSYHDRVDLNFRFRNIGEDWQYVSQTVYLTSTPCHLGGVRHWFRCPNCDGRVAMLYLFCGKFLCRKCHGLPYRSQQKGEMTCLMDKIHKLGYRIFDDYDGYGGIRKRGMHKSTFWPLYDRYQKLDEQFGRKVETELGT